MKPDSRPDRPAIGLLAATRERLRYLLHRLRTEEAYIGWIRRFIAWSGRRHPRTMDGAEVRGFLQYLATDRRVSASTHRQALSALLFLDRDVLGQDLPWMAEIGRPQAARRLPRVMATDEVGRVLAAMDVAPGDGVPAPVARLLDGSGLRLMEGLRLRVKDLDFDRGVVIVRDGKGGKDRVAMLPRTLESALRARLSRARPRWQLGLGELTSHRARETVAA